MYAVATIIKKQDVETDSFFVAPHVGGHECDSKGAAQLPQKRKDGLLEPVSLRLRVCGWGKEEACIGIE